MDVDVPALFSRLLERQKEYVLEDRENYRCAMVVVIAPEGMHLDFPKFQDEEAKSGRIRRL